MVSCPLRIESSPFTWNVNEALPIAPSLIVLSSRFANRQREEWFDSYRTQSECHPGMFDQQSSNGSNLLGEGWTTSDRNSNHSYTNQSNHVHQSASRSSTPRERERDESLQEGRHLSFQMNEDDDFGQYTCVAENTHGRTEGIVFVLRKSSVLFLDIERCFHLLIEESTVPSTLPTTVITSRKSPRYSRYSSSREDSTRTQLESSVSTITYVERDIRLSSSAPRLWFSSLWIFLCVRLKDLQRWECLRVCVCVCDSDRTMFILHHVHPASLASWMARCR